MNIGDRHTCRCFPSPVTPLDAAFSSSLHNFWTAPLTILSTCLPACLSVCVCVGLSQVPLPSLPLPLSHPFLILCLNVECFVCLSVYLLLGLSFFLGLFVSLFFFLCFLPLLLCFLCLSIHLSINLSMLFSALTPVLLFMLPFPC